MRWSALIPFALALSCFGCQSQAQRLDEANQSIESIRATTTTAANAWLSGTVSDRFAHAAIERAYELSEQTRTSLAASPTSMADSRAAAATADCEHLSRVLARLGDAIERGDRAAAHTALADIGAPARRSARTDGEVTP